MTIAEAKSLLTTCSFTMPETWADLGCGNGTFTYALAELLQHKSSIYAIDQQKQKLHQIYAEIPITFQQADFANDLLRLPPLNGILMANSLHYVKDQHALIKKLEGCFINDNKRWIIIEYEHQVANQWEPYPVPFDQLNTLYRQFGYSSITKIAERKSTFGGMMYAALITSN